MEGVFNTARSVGASEVRIEATFANSSLQKVLAERYGGVLSSGPSGKFQDAITFGLKR